MPKQIIVTRKVGRGRKKRIRPLGPGPVLLFIILVIAAWLIVMQVETPLR